MSLVSAPFWHARGTGGVGVAAADHLVAKYAQTVAYRRLPGLCGNGESVKKQVNEILDQFGWETADMGAAEAARAIEPLCMLWCIPGLLSNQWTHAFKLLKL